MRRNLITSLAAAIGTLLFSMSLYAHHGASVVYDLSQSVTVSGEVSDFQFVNPHVLVFFSVQGDDGEAVTWSAGLTSPNRLARSNGWSRDTLKPGDQITITGNPARSGAPSLWVEKIVDASGAVLIGDDS
jgi:hypothetical protein